MKKKNNNKGFSLIELIIAIAILVILTGLLAPQFMRYMEKARESKDMQVLDSLYGSVQTALADENGYALVKDGTLADITTKGMSLEDILKATDAFSKEVQATLGAKTGDKLWSSKAVTAMGGDASTYVFIDKSTLKVTVWIGKAATKADEVLVGLALNPSAITNGVANTQTSGVTFWISK